MNRFWHNENPSDLGRDHSEDKNRKRKEGSGKIEADGVKNGCLVRFVHINNLVCLA